MGRTDSPAADVRWVSTHEAAAIIGCHPQTVRDRCARGELPFRVDPASGHRRIDASALKPLRRPRDNGKARPAVHGPSEAGFRASVTADVAGALNDSAMQGIADRLVEALAERDAALTTTAERLGKSQTGLRALAEARFWQRPRVLAQLRADGLLSPRD